jgi:FMN-dependent NADH-azoreductase
VLVTARGGAYGETTPRSGWDHALPWMRRILKDVWQLELAVVETELTLADLRPPLDEQGQLAKQIHAAADELARSSGRALGLQRGRVKT